MKFLGREWEAKWEFFFVIIVWASPSTGHAGARNGQRRVGNKNCSVFGYFSLASFMFEVFLVAFSASFWKKNLVQLLPRKGHPGDADDASYSFDFCRGRRFRAASQ